MAFFFTCGTHTFQSLLKGAEHVTAQCQNCGNWSAKVITRWEWFTFCFVPIIPFSFKPWQEVHCHICNFHQDIKYRPDVQQQMNNGGGGGGQEGQQQIPMQNGPPQGWNSQQPQQPSGQPAYK